MTFPCAISPLDQAATQLGWHQGTFARSPCPYLRPCTQRQEGLQFLADAGTPVVAPFDARAGRLSNGSLLLEVAFDVPRAIASPPVRVTVSGIRVEVPNGPVQRGSLLGRVAPSSRPSATFTLTGGSAGALFQDLGLDVVGAERPSLPGYGLVPFRGGRLLARAGGPADCPAAGGLHGWVLGTGVAPSGYVEPDSAVYARFGQSKLSSTRNAPPGSSGGGWGLLAWLGVGVVVWSATRR